MKKTIVTLGMLVAVLVLGILARGAVIEAVPAMQTPEGQLVRKSFVGTIEDVVPGMSITVRTAHGDVLVQHPFIFDYV